MRRISSFLVRIFSFLSKEITEILRQPKLILTLILGPFLILLLFGIGYTNQRVPERTMFVLQQDNPFNEQIQSKLEELDYVIDLVGTTDDFELMISNLNRNAIDLGVVIPDNVYETISSINRPPSRFITTKSIQTRSLMRNTWGLFSPNPSIDS